MAEQDFMKAHKSKQVIMRMQKEKPQALKSFLKMEKAQEKISTLQTELQTKNEEKGKKKKAGGQLEQRQQKRKKEKLKEEKVTKVKAAKKEQSDLKAVAEAKAIAEKQLKASEVRVKELAKAAEEGDGTSKDEGKENILLRAENERMKYEMTTKAKAKVLDQGGSDHEKAEMEAKEMKLKGDLAEATLKVASLNK